YPKEAVEKIPVFYLTLTYSIISNQEGDGINIEFESDSFFPAPFFIPLQVKTDMSRLQAPPVPRL
ncbi:MAG: hypothetical protein ACLUYS_09065, partial [Allobaculum sp.]|uniref:hypothetical protein n=1 Tax=Allobaculum sp. TaxID=1872463 RepID=UPI0039998D37